MLLLLFSRFSYLFALVVQSLLWTFFLASVSFMPLLAMAWLFFITAKSAFLARYLQKSLFFPGELAISGPVDRLSFLLDVLFSRIT